MPTGLLMNPQYNTYNIEYPWNDQHSPWEKSPTQLANSMGTYKKLVNNMKTQKTMGVGTLPSRGSWLLNYNGADS